MSQGEKEMWKREQLRESKKKNLPVGRMHSFRFQTPPHLDFFMFYLPSSLSFFIFILSFFLPLPSGPPSLLASISSPVLHLHSFFNHISLTNLMNHLECLNENSLEGPKSFGHGLSSGSCLGMLWCSNKHKNNRPKNRILKWKVVYSRPLSSLCQVYWFAHCGAVKTL